MKRERFGHCPPMHGTSTPRDCLTDSQVREMAREVDGWRILSWSEILHRAFRRANDDRPFPCWLAKSSALCAIPRRFTAIAGRRMNRQTHLPAPTKSRLIGQPGDVRKEVEEILPGLFGQQRLHPALSALPARWSATMSSAPSTRP